ncbi:outer membrane protein assembly factor BamB family protein, partial [Singulisphaera rosea]
AARREPLGKTTTDSLGDPLPPGARLRLGTLRFRPPSNVAELALSPDDKTIVSFGDELIAWDSANGKELWRAGTSDVVSQLPIAAYGARLLAFSSDSSRFYTPLGPDGVKVWETASGRQEALKLAPRKTAIGAVNGVARSIDVTSDGATLALGNPAGVAIYDRSGAVLYEIVNAPQKPADPSHTDRLAFYDHYSFGQFSPDGTTLAVVLSEKPDELRLYEARTGRELRPIALKGRLVRLAFSPDSKRLAATERDSAVRLYDVATGERIWSHIVKLANIYENYTSAIAFHPDGKSLAVCATDYRIYVLDPSTGEEQASLAGHHWYPWCLAFTSKGERLYSSGWDATIRGWDVAGRKQLSLTPTGHATGVITISPDGKTLAFGRLVAEDEGHARFEVVVQESPERKRILLKHALETYPVRASELPSLAVVWSPDGRYLAVPLLQQTLAVAIIRADNGRILKMVEDAYFPAWSPDGTKLAFVRGTDPATLLFLDTNFGAPRVLADIGKTNQAPVWFKQSILVVARRGGGAKGNALMRRSELLRVPIDGSKVEAIPLVDTADRDKQFLGASFGFDREGDNLFYAVDILGEPSVVTWYLPRTKETYKRDNPIDFKVRVGAFAVAPNGKTVALRAGHPDDYLPPGLWDPVSHRLSPMVADDSARVEWVLTLVAGAKSLLGDYLPATVNGPGRTIERPSVLPIPGEISSTPEVLTRLQRLARIGRPLCDRPASSPPVEPEVVTSRSRCFSRRWRWRSSGLTMGGSSRWWRMLTFPRGRPTVR